MGIWDTLSGWASDAGDFISDNSSWLKPVASLASGARKQSNVDNSQSQYQDYLRQREQKNYEDSVAAINAYNQALGQGPGGGDGGAARAAAARQTEANRMQASKKANKFTKNMYKDLLKIYAPYRETADRLLPQMTQTYEGSLGMQNNMMKYLQDPEQMKKLNASGPAWNVNVPLPDSVRLK